ncbi:hypothetical protein QZH41_005890 [Actinostola sp. cb2023]|nr:hypothetical protein QZH41_005890 [Actinostola sp. cb2023]
MADSETLSEDSEVLSDLGEEGEEESVERRNEVQFGLLPYQFEPIGQQVDVEEVEAEPQTAMEVERADRLGNTDWCTCGNCVTMETVEESSCCQEIPRIQDKILLLEIENPPTCITGHPGFQSVCLDMWVLQTAYFFRSGSAMAGE